MKQAGGGGVGMEQQQESALLELPTDALLAVLGYLGPQDLLRCACCCHLLSTLARSYCLWIPLCSPWRHLLHLPSWRSSVDSAPALFRLLSAFQNLVGPWTAQGQQPRGSLLYITWGSSCLVAFKVFPSLTGELKLTRVFEVLGLRDGSFMVEIISKDPENAAVAGTLLPGKLVWNSGNASEFTVEANEQKEGFGQTVERIHGDLHPPEIMFPNIRILEEQDGASEQVARARRISLLQHLLDRRFVNEEDQHGPQESSGLNFSQRALQYLIRLAVHPRNSLGLEGNPNEASSMELGGIMRCSYSRLTVEETTTETDLVGLWMGVYGPHGAEIINVTQTGDGIFGTKVLGDPNVPCGQVSFRVNRWLETTGVPVNFQQIVDLQLSASFQPFHIVKMFQGYGRIAGHNFRNPLWVPGHLFMSSSGQIAFLWEGVNFVVPFEKLNLEALYQSQKCQGMIV